MDDWKKRAVDVGAGFYFCALKGGVGQIVDEDGDHVHYVANADWARAWVGGYLKGLNDGALEGAEKARRAIRDALGVPHPKAEE